MGRKDKVRAVGKTPAAEIAQETPANNEREHNCGRGLSCLCGEFYNTEGSF